MRPWLPIAASIVFVATDARALACPSTAPSAGAACDAAASCEYGGDAHGLCATLALCVGGSWHLDAPDAACGASPADCPSSFTAFDSGARCPLADPNALCAYPEGACSCTKPCREEDGGVDFEWVCRAWYSGGPGCPSARPALGAACNQDGAICAWNGCCWDVPLGPDEQCVDGHWTLHPSNTCGCDAPESCPLSATLDAGASDASTGDDERRVTAVASGCSCELGTTDGTPLVWLVSVIALALTTRRFGRNHAPARERQPGAELEGSGVRSPRP